MALPDQFRVAPVAKFRPTHFVVTRSGKAFAIFGPSFPSAAVGVPDFSYAVSDLRASSFIALNLNNRRLRNHDL